MSFEVTITADSIASLGAKMLAMGTQLSGKHDPVMPEVAATEPKVTRARGATAKEAEKPPEPAVEQAATTTAEAPATEPQGDEPVVLDFTRDVTPAVLECLKTKGKPVVEEVLSQFGVSRASELDASQFPELVAALNDAMAA